MSVWSVFLQHLFFLYHLILMKVESACKVTSFALFCAKILLITQHGHITSNMSVLHGRQYKISIQNLFIYYIWQLCTHGSIYLKWPPSLQIYWEFLRKSDLRYMSTFVCSIKVVLWTLLSTEDLIEHTNVDMYLRSDFLKNS